jgi:tetratricopeptide (TPR) repeat protein
MKTIQKTITLFTILLFTQLVVAQYGVQKRGDYYFGQFAYTKAIGEYEKMIEKDFNTAHAHQRLAECYLLIRNFKKSIPHFEAIVNNTSVSTDYYFKYALALYRYGQQYLA